MVARGLGVVLAIVLVMVVTALRRSARIEWAPLAAHNLPWAISLLFWASGTVAYTTASVSAFAVMLLGILAFNAGVLVNVKNRVATRTGQTLVATDSQLSLTSYLTLLTGYVIGFAWYLFTISHYFGIGTLVHDPTLIRQYGDVNYLEVFPLPGKLLFYLAPLLMALTANAAMVRGLKSAPWALRAALFFVIAISQFASLGRTNVFVGIAWSIILYLLRSTGSTDRRHNNHRIAAVGAGAIGAILVFQIVGNALGKSFTENPQYSPYLTSNVSKGPLGTMIVYGSSGTPAFLRLVNSQDRSWPPDSQPPIYGDYNPVTHGAATFATLGKVVPIFKPWPEIDPFINVPFPINIYTWFDPWYRDFRAPGVVAFSFIAGLIASAVCRRKLRSTSALLLAAIVLTNIVWAPFTNRILTTMSLEYYFLALLFGLSRGTRLVQRNRASAISKSAS